MNKLGHEYTNLQAKKLTNKHTSEQTKEKT